MPAFSLWYFASKTLILGQKVQLKIVSVNLKYSPGSFSIPDRNVFTFHSHLFIVSDVNYRYQGHSELATKLFIPVT